MDFEKLGAFYLGRPYDLAAGQPKPGLTLYDSTDLVTHAVCVGMTGSGKTGLCLCLLEEAAIDGVPAIAIDPKGDLGNLLLTFPDLSAESFAPWVDADEARRKGLTVDQFAAAQSELWKKGLGEWGQDGSRIQRLRDAAEFAIYTPGSEAGLPVSILRSFAAPPAAIRDDDELLRERVATTVSSLLGLVGVSADPLRSREHILTSTILERAWRAEQDLDLAALIHQIQSPGLERVGVLDLESFFPSKDRFELATLLNNLIASPGFSSWMNGEPLDVGRFLHGPSGKPRISIFSIAHLSEPQRMFFVSLLLNEVLGWVRTQTGSSSLRAILYMDEIAGYVPPVAAPPSKAPLLTLMKQARAYGFGVVLATQNPVDLDYKGLSNAGTWFLGRLQTERDKARVIEGLEGAAATSGARFDRAQLEQTLSALGSRVFLMNNVHEDAPEIFQTRWALCYLRGPLSRQDIKRLMSERGLASAPPPSPPAAGAARQATATVQAAPPVTADRRPTADRPVLPPEIPQYFAPARGADAPHYRPMLLGSAQIRYADTKTKVDLMDEVLLVTPIAEGPAPIDWTTSSGSPVALNAFGERPAEGATFAPLPSAAARAKSYDAWSKAFSAWLAGNRRLSLFYCDALKMTSQPGEDERAFRIRLQQVSRERRDAAVEQLRRKFAPKIASLQDRVRRAAQVTERQSGQVGQHAVQTGISMVATAVGALFGRKTISSTLGRATTAARGMGRTMREREDVARAKENESALQEQLEASEHELAAEIENIHLALNPAALALEPVMLAPKKSHVTVRLVALAWIPETSG
jgi:hypothetical protein